MHPVQWCYGCLCDFGLQDPAHYCKMTTENLFNLPLNIYIIILGIGLFILMLSLIFCCYLFRLRRQGAREHYGYNEVVLKGAGKKLSLLGQTCAVCLEEFRSRDELGVCPCSHAFHKKCLLKWLEIRVCVQCATSPFVESNLSSNKHLSSHRVSRRSDKGAPSSSADHHPFS